MLTISVTMSCVTKCISWFMKKLILKVVISTFEKVKILAISETTWYFDLQISKICSSPSNILNVIKHINVFIFYFFSAGIGRTGVLITMETAMCLIECNQPVYPLDIVRTMRDQRAMMIQTPVSSRSTSGSAVSNYKNA